MTFTGTKLNLHTTMNIKRFYHYIPITSNINQPSMLMTILNIEQARSSNVKRDQPNLKLASNWHFTEFFRIFLLIF
jgi:hypothetical protein